MENLNPHEILGIPESEFNPGALKSPHDDRDFLWSEAGMASLPFDWVKGYDYEEELSALLGKPFKTPIKNQNGSGSCGGQSEGYGGASVSAFNEKVYEEKSAKYAYAPVAILPGGGSFGRDLAARAIKFGWGSELLTPSYDNGNPPSEAFMDRVQDITQAAIEHAKKDRALNYVLLPLDIDEIAKAIRDYKFVRIGVTGSNNGTWGGLIPVAPKDGEKFWYHWITGLKAKMVNGKKAIGFPNSWGTGVGDQGWQWLTEDYFKALLTNNPLGSTPIFEPRCYTWNPNPLDPAFSHTFNIDLEKGMVSPENIQLQTALRIDGDFPEGIPYSQNFGNATLAAVQKFQIKYVLVAGPTTPGYGRCGPITRAKLNSLFGN